jgi:hypothetical protein
MPPLVALLYAVLSILTTCRVELSTSYLKGRRAQPVHHAISYAEERIEHSVRAHEANVLPITLPCCTPLSASEGWIRTSSRLQPKWSALPNRLLLMRGAMRMRH